MLDGARRGSLRWSRLVVLAVVVVGAVAGAFTPAAAPAGAPVTVTVTPTTELRDGQVVSINVKSTPEHPVYAAEARVCRPGVDYQPSSGVRPNIDAAVGGANCPLTPVSSSADVSVVDPNMFLGSATPEGQTFTIKVGVGAASWNGDAGPQSLACDADHPCTLVVQIFGGPGAPVWVPHTFPLTYRTSDPIAGCGGPGPGIIGSGGSDRFFDAWIEWTLDYCERTGSKAISRATFNGEAEAVRAFATGSLDLAYTAAGYSDEIDLVPADELDPTLRRKAVAVPLAVDAVVIAVGNGQPGPGGKKVPYTDIRLTLDEVATLLSGGSYAMSPHLDAIYARNPELAATGFFNTGSTFQVGGEAEAGAPNWFMTHHLDTLRPDAWRVPQQTGVFGEDAGKPRGADAALATASPAFTNALTLLSGRPAVLRNLQSLAASDYGGVWFLTTLSTARALGLTPVAIETGGGEFVAPTAESMAAAIPTLRTIDGGLLVPDPAPASAGRAGPGAYPLTFVEYALVPAEPLVEDNCDPRTVSQQNLEDWLTYVTGPGQAKLPAGLTPLPEALRSEAAARLEEVGASPVTGPCAAEPVDPGAEPTPDAPPVAAAPVAGSGGGPAGGALGPFGSIGSNAGRAASPAAAVAAGAADVATEAGSGETTPETAIATLVGATLPGGAGGRVPNGFVAVLALVGVVATLALAVRATVRGTTAAEGPSDAERGRS